MADWLPPAAVAEADADPEHARLARFITNTFNPVTLALPMIALGVYISRQPGAWRHALVYALVVVVVPLVDMLYLLQTGKVSDFHMARRGERIRPFLVSLLCLTVALTLMRATHAPEVLVAMGRATLLQGVVLFAITLRWQISVHTATAASVVTFLVLAFGAEALGFVLLVPAVAWARVHLRRHNWPQVVAGAIVGATAMLVCLAGILY